MTVALGDYVSIQTGGWSKLAAAGSPPATPTLSVADDKTGTSVTATVAGEAGATHQLYYRAGGAAGWTTGESRDGDGTKVQGSLTLGTYVFVAQSSLVGVLSRMSDPVWVQVTDGTTVGLAVRIADAVVTELELGSFSQAITPVRNVSPVEELPDLATLHVTVVPKRLVPIRLTRSKRQYDVTIDVAIREKISDLDAETGSLNLLLDEIEAFLETQGALTAVPGAQWVESEVTAPYSPDHLRDQRAYFGLVAVTYRLIQA